MSDFDFEERSCPLPVVRKRETDDGEDFTLHVEMCGEVLFTEHTEGKYLLVGGECDSCGPTWQVSCANGHVLLVPDHDGDDNYSRIPYDDGRTDTALLQVGGHTTVTITDDHEECSKEVAALAGALLYLGVKPEWIAEARALAHVPDVPAREIVE